MAYKAYTSDLRRVVEVTPDIDVEGRVILAKVFEDGELLGVANAVQPDMTNAQVHMEVNNATFTNQTITATLYGKRVLDGVEEQITQQTLLVPAGLSVQDIELDHSGYIDLRLRIEVDGNAEVAITDISVSSGMVSDLEGVVVGGVAGEVIAIPCDFTRFTESDNYTLVIEAVGVGLISKDLLILFDDDGYTVE